MVMTKVTTKKVAVKVEKPRVDFPLFPHARGYWAKKVCGRLRYFGKVADDPKGKAALEKWLAERDDLLAGREPRNEMPAGITIRDLANAFLTHKQDLVNAEELCQRTFDEYFNTCDRLIRSFGRERPVDDLVADDFRRLRAQIARRWGPIRLSNEIQRVRSVFKYGFDAGLLDKSVRFGPDFKKPSAKVLRQNRAAAGPKMFEREELSALLESAGPNMKAMILLAINGGLGNGDIAGLTFSAVNLKTGWLMYPRPKTGIDRRIPLWTETMRAINDAIAMRQPPKDDADKDLVFISRRGTAYLAANGYRIAGEFIRLLTNAKIKQRGFYCIRHTFQTIGEGAHDLSAVQSIMGHAASGNDMSARYRERIEDTRLLAVTEHVRKWLFGDQKTG
jgi:integrase